MRCECDRTTADKKRNWAEQRALWYALAAIFRTRHGKRKWVFRFFWLSLIGSNVAWLGSLRGEYQDCVRMC